MVTFDPHPRTTLGNSVELLCTLGRRLELLEACGIEDVLVIEFTPETADLSPTEFAHDVPGHDRCRGRRRRRGFRFGRRREGDCDLLRSLGLDVREVPLVAGVSSTRIRALAKAGEVEAAAKLLGRPIEIDGVVVGGDRRGGTLGFPTANLRVEPNLVVPAYGIYAGAVGERRAAVSIGVNPHYGGSERRIEAFSSTGRATSTATGSWSSSGAVCETSAPSRAKPTSSPRSPATSRRRARRRARRRPSTMPKLILLNGPPAVGKSTLARRYADAHPLTLVLEIDAVRALLGSWLDEW